MITEEVKPTPYERPPIHHLKEHIEREEN